MSITAYAATRAQAELVNLLRTVSRPVIDMAFSHDNPEPLQYVQDRELVQRVQFLLDQSREIIARTRLLIQESEELLERQQRLHSSGTKRQL
jgi:hypothetical protein